MAKQAIGFKVSSGSIGDLQFAKRKGRKGKKEYIVGEKGGVDRATILNAPEFENTRKNMSEFGRAGTMSKDFNNLLSGVLSGTKSSQATSSFTGLIRTLMNLDATNGKGDRVLDLSVSEVSQGLVGFSWSKENFNNIMIGDLTIDTIGASDVQLVGDFAFNSPVEADKVEILYTSVSKDATGSYSIGSTRSFGALDMPSDSLDSSTISHGGATGEMILVIASVKFYQTVNGTDYELRNKSYRAATVVYAGLVPAV